MSEFTRGKSFLHLMLLYLGLPVSAVMIWVCLSTYAAGLASLGYSPMTGVVKSESFETGLEVRKFLEIAYTIDGKELRARTKAPTDRLIKVGETLEVYVDPNTHQHITLDRGVDYDTVIIQGAFGFALLSFWTIAVVNGRRRRLRVAASHNNFTSAVHYRR